MSKAEGRNIIIKFTDDLVGDVSDNINAFTVTGKEYQWVDGPDNNGLLLDKGYQIDRIERYGFVPIWKIEEEAKLDSDGEPIQSQTWNVDVPSTGNPATGTRGFKFSPQQDCYVIKFRMKPTESTSTLHLWDVATGALLSTITKTTTVNIWNEIELSASVFIQEGKEYIVSANYTVGANYYRNSSAEQSQYNYINYLGHYTGSSHDVIPTSSVAWANAVDIIIETPVDYLTPKTCNTSLIQHTGSCRVRWQEDKPIDTNITIEYTTGQTQGEWIEVSNGEVITTDTNLWFRITLETTDTSVTPTLQDLWIEEPDAPQDKIRIVFDDYSRFPSVVGDITVEYDASLGNLAGSGGAVESFIETFTPTGLVAEPNIGIHDSVTVAPASLEVDFLPIEYIDRFAEETDTITVAPAELTVELLHTSVVNP